MSRVSYSMQINIIKSNGKTPIQHISLGQADEDPVPPFGASLSSYVPPLSSLTLWVLTRSASSNVLLWMLSWLGDGCKSTDNMTFSLTDDGQEGHYYELLAQLSAAVTLWLYVDTDDSLDFLGNASKNPVIRWTEVARRKGKTMYVHKWKKVEESGWSKERGAMETWEGRRWEERGSRGIQMRGEN